jgi:hypothetical protein
MNTILVFAPSVLVEVGATEVVSPFVLPHPRMMLSETAAMASEQILVFMVT